MQFKWYRKALTRNSTSCRHSYEFTPIADLKCIALFSLFCSCMDTFWLIIVIINQSWNGKCVIWKHVACNEYFVQFQWEFDPKTHKLLKSHGSNWIKWSHKLLNNN